MRRVTIDSQKLPTRCSERTGTATHHDARPRKAEEDTAIAPVGADDRELSNSEAQAMARLHFEHHGRYLEDQAGEDVIGPQGEAGHIDDNEVYHPPLSGLSDSSSDETPSTSRASPKRAPRAKSPPDAARTAAQPQQPVTARQVAELVGVVATAPLRLLFGLGAAALGTAVQAMSSLQDAIRPEAQHPMPWRATAAEKDAVSFATYQQRVIIKSPDTTRLWDPIGPEVAYAQVNHGVRDEDVISLAMEGNTLRVNTPRDRPLSELGLSGRLDFIAHGNETTAGDLPPAALAELLQGLGLKKVGVINIASCDAGTASYLPDLAQELHQRGIDFGWLAGAKGFAGTLETSSRMGGSSYNWRWLMLPWRRFAGALKPMALNRRLVPGNVDVKFARTVFDKDRPWWRIASRW